MLSNMLLISTCQNHCCENSCENLRRAGRSQRDFTKKRIAHKMESSFHMSNASAHEGTSILIFGMQVLFFGFVRSNLPDHQECFACVLVREAVELIDLEQGKCSEQRASCQCSKRTIRSIRHPKYSFHCCFTIPYSSTVIIY